MANRNFDQAYTLGKNRVVLQGSFATNGSSNPTAVQGKGFSVTRTGTGTYLVSFQDAFVSFDAAGTDLQTPTPSANWAQLGPIDVSGAKTLTLTTVNASGTAVDIAAAANSRVHFSVTMVNTTIK